MNKEDDTHTKYEIVVYKIGGIFDLDGNRIRDLTPEEEKNT